jgi:hypothetical protein
MVLGAFLFLFFLPADFFDTGESMCLSVLFFDLECLGCGLTRGMMYLMHLEFQTAWQFNKLSFIILPIGILFWIHLFGVLIDKPYLSFFKRLY